MNISIVLPAFNEEKLLPRTLAALAEARQVFTERGWESEVIVCDNNSTDRTAEIARAGGAFVVFEPVNQIARARNTGAAVARGEWLLFLDADTVPTRELLAEASRLIAGGEVLFIGAVVQLDDPLDPVSALVLKGWNLLSRTLRWMAGSFVAVETSAFREVGGFDLGLYAGEEVELSRRLKALARWRGKQTAIIRKYPVTSSARRLKFSTRREIFRFIFRAIFSPRAVTRDREACAMWYDGRR